jgi:hypothetical protein
MKNDLLGLLALAMKKSFQGLFALIICFGVLYADDNPSSSESAQDRTITGTVTSSEDDQGLPGVNVIIRGTATGTVTDIEGNYSLNVPSEADVLIFSSVGLCNTGNNHRFPERH